MKINRVVYVGNIIERVKAYVLPSDLPDALKAFKERTGLDATMVEVSEKIFPVLETVIPEGIELLIGGCSHYEIRLSSEKWKGMEKVIPQPTVTIPQTLQDANLGVTIHPLVHRDTPIRMLHPPKPSKELPPVQKAMFKTRDERIDELKGSGGTRKIADIMQGEGYKVSHMTVARRLQGRLL